MAKRSFEIFTDKLTIIVKASTFSEALQYALLEFGSSEKIIAIIDYERVVRGDYIKKHHQGKPYCFIIKHNEVEYNIESERFNNSKFNFT